MEGVGVVRGEPILFPELTPEEREKNLHNWVKKITAPGYRPPPLNLERISYPFPITLVVGSKIPDPPKEKFYDVRFWQEL